MHGQIARRTVRHFGFDYDYGSFQLTETEALPVALHWMPRLRADRRRRPLQLAAQHPAGALRYSLTFRTLRGATT